MNSLLRASLSLRNALDLTLRNLLAWSPPAHETPEPKDALFEDFPAALAKELARREQDLTSRFQLSSARARMTQARWLRTLSFLEMLEQFAAQPAFAAWKNSGPQTSFLDIGSKNFDYVDALAGFWQLQTGPAFSLTGLELDAHRRYTDFRTRRAWAKHYVSFWKEVEFRAENLLDHQGQYAAITWFFPFLTEVPLLKWGLPRRFLQPGRLLDKAAEFLPPGGLLLLAHHTAGEQELQLEWLQARPFQVFNLGTVPDSFREGGRQRWLTLAVKTPQ